MNIGILGGGQLARMLALGGIPLGFTFTLFDPSKDICGADVAEHICAPYSDMEALDRFISRVDYITYEFENVPEETVEYLAKRKPLYPSPKALKASCDRLIEKSLFRELSIDTPDFREINSLEDLRSGVEALGLPAILKTRRMGYDGKGQAVIKDISDLQAAWESVGKVPSILEAFVQFSREVSIIAVRSQSGECRFYPLSENEHSNGILRVSYRRNSDPLQSRAEEFIKLLLDKLDYTGVMALELFDTADGIKANEMAPRVHNSGHWTIEGAPVSQFENHIRAVVNLPLGETVSNFGQCAMVNYIGEIPSAKEVLSIAGSAYHNYRKEPKSGRKLGHATVCTETTELLQQRCEELCKIGPIL